MIGVCTSFFLVKWMFKVLINSCSDSFFVLIDKIWNFSGKSLNWTSNRSVYPPLSFSSLSQKVLFYNLVLNMQRIELLQVILKFQFQVFNRKIINLSTIFFSKQCDTLCTISKICGTHFAIIISNRLIWIVLIFWFHGGRFNIVDN